MTASPAGDELPLVEPNPVAVFVTEVTKIENLPEGRVQITLARTTAGGLQINGPSLIIPSNAIPQLIAQLATWYSLGHRRDTRHSRDRCTASAALVQMVPRRSTASSAV